MCLCGDEPRMFRNFYNSSVRRSSAKFHAMLGESGTIIIVYFITMTMTLGNLSGSVYFICFGILVQYTRISAES